MIPLWLKIADTLFVYLIVPIYWRRYGPANFLWFSDVALLLTVPALWLESPLLVSMMALAVALPELAWNIDFFVRLTTGVSLLASPLTCSTVAFRDLPAVCHCSTSACAAAHLAAVPARLRQARLHRANGCRDRYIATLVFLQRPAPEYQLGLRLW